jgi:hypothetical protein
MSLQSHKPPFVELIQDVQTQQRANLGLAAIDTRRLNDSIQYVAHHQSMLEKTAANPFADTRDPYFAANCKVHEAAVKRGSQAVQLYLQSRLNRIVDLWWLNQDEVEECRKNMTETEVAFLSAYNDLVADYSRSFEPNLDFRAFVTKPPCSKPYERITIRGLKRVDYISPVTQESIRIYPGVQSDASFADAESLVRQGAAEYVKDARR